MDVIIQRNRSFHVCPLIYTLDKYHLISCGMVSEVKEIMRISKNSVVNFVGENFHIVSYFSILNLPRKNLREKFDNFPWVKDNNRLLVWQQGQTGVPMVDAGMRELWQTGYMHNRVRMIVGSFLVKNLLIHWHHGERWFWDTLVDADLANNCGNWQWVAGCGVDAAPYFRIFNPVSQGKKFDPGGHYIRQYVPEIAKLSNKYLFNPWSAPAADTGASAGIKLGETYPTPIVDLKKSREARVSCISTH